MPTNNTDPNVMEEGGAGFADNGFEVVVPSEDVMSIVSDDSEFDAQAYLEGLQEELVSPPRRQVLDAAVEDAEDNSLETSAYALIIYVSAADVLGHPASYNASPSPCPIEETSDASLCEAYMPALFEPMLLTFHDVLWPEARQMMSALAHNIECSASHFAALVLSWWKCISSKLLKWICADDDRASAPEYCEIAREASTVAAVEGDAGSVDNGFEVVVPSEDVMSIARDDSEFDAQAYLEGLQEESVSPPRKHLPGNLVKDAGDNSLETSAYALIVYVSAADVLGLPASYNASPSPCLIEERMDVTVQQVCMAPQSHPMLLTFHNMLRPEAALCFRVRVNEIEMSATQFTTMFVYWWNCMNTRLLTWKDDDHASASELSDCAREAPTGAAIAQERVHSAGEEPANTYVTLSDDDNKMWSKLCHLLEASDDEDAASADNGIDSDQMAFDIEVDVDTPQESALPRKRFWAQLGRMVKRSPPTKVSRLLYRMMKRPASKMAKFVSNAQFLRRWPARVFRRLIGAKSRLRLEPMTDDDIWISISLEDISGVSSPMGEGGGADSKRDRRPSPVREAVDVDVDGDTQEHVENQEMLVAVELPRDSTDEDVEPDTGEFEVFWGNRRLAVP